MERSNEFRFSRNIPVRQLPENRSGITLVWLENTPKLSWDERHIRLNSFSDRCFIVYYSSVLKCMKYLKRPRSREYIIAIMVPHPMETIQRIIHRLQPYRVIQTIFVVCKDTAGDDHLSLPRSNIPATGSHMILQERCGKVTGSHRRAPEIAGSGSSIPTGNLLDFFQWIPINSLCFPAGTGRKSSEKIRKFSGWNTASTFR